MGAGGNAGDDDGNAGEGGKTIKPTTKIVSPPNQLPTPARAPAKASPPGGNGIAARAQTDAMPSKNPPALKPDFEKQHGDYYLAKYTIKGVSIHLSIMKTERATVENNLVGIADAMNAANTTIADPGFRVKLCAIANATTRFTTYKGQPIIVLAPQDAHATTARHELGHAIFNYLRGIQKEKHPPRGAALQIVDIYARLKATKPVKATKRALDIESGQDKEVEVEQPAGLWIADPPQWSSAPGVRSEHPWKDADELFASAREAFLGDRKGFEASIERFAKFDPRVSEPANQLLAVLEALSKGRAPKPTKLVPSESAETDLSGMDSATPAEVALDSPINDTLRWALDPSTWPWDQP
jgi:hypothetical protein